LKRQRNVEREVPEAVKKEEILDRTASEYEAIVAIAKEARRLNAVPGVFLKKGETALPKAVENFVGGRVDYEVEGAELEACPPDTGRKKAVKAAKKTKKTKKTAGRAARKGAGRK
jgi:hypothetical protein